MIKIHAGKFKGINIKRVQVDSTKETASMVREAVFNMLFMVNGDVLDLFAGSGSLGITALSLGASSCIFVDNNVLAIKTIKDNLLKVKDNSIVVKDDFKSFLNSNSNQFDLVLLDPPYNFNDYLNLLNAVSVHMKDNSRIVLEVSKKTLVVDEFNNFKLAKNKVYGSKRILIYNKEN